jgi:hypothetical protein
VGIQDFFSVGADSPCRTIEMKIKDEKEVVVK